MFALLVGDVGAGVADEDERDEQAHKRYCERSDPDHRAGSDARGQAAAGERRGCDAQVAGRLVDSQRQSPSLRTGEVYLHHHGHRPSETLVRAEQQVCKDDHPPTWGEGDQGRYGQSDEPPQDE